MGKHLRGLVLLVIGASLLSASTVVPLGFTELSKLANRVVVGRIERITSYEDAQSGRILSRVEIAPSRSLTGSPLSPLSFDMTGGAVGDRRQWISGFPQLKAGDRVVLFLAEDTSTPLGPTVGLWQGVFFIENDPVSGAEAISDHRRGPVSEIRGEEIVVGDARRAGRLTVDAFVDRVLVQRRKAGKDGIR